MSLFLDRRMRRIFLLGVMSGFPWVLIGSSLSLWLKEDGLSRSAVGWAGLIFAVYAVNFLWAPLVDRLRLPYLTDRLGHRKSWILLMQGYPGQSAGLVAACAFSKYHFGYWGRAVDRDLLCNARHYY